MRAGGGAGHGQGSGEIEQGSAQTEEGKAQDDRGQPVDQGRRQARRLRASGPAKREPCPDGGTAATVARWNREPTHRERTAVADKSLSDISEAMRDIDFCMLTTVSDDGLAG